MAFNSGIKEVVYNVWMSNQTFEGPLSMQGIKINKSLNSYRFIHEVIQETDSFVPSLFI